MRKVWLALLGIVAAFVGSYVTLALARAEDRYNKELFGHRVRIVGKNKEDVERLTIDGKTIVENWSVSIDDVRTIAGVGVLIGKSNDGGNACDADVFVVSFPKNAAPRLDPTDECSSVTYKIEGNAIRFTSDAEGYKPLTWTWTPAKGMSAKVAAVIPNPFQNSDLWEDLRTGRVFSPSPSVQAPRHE